MKIILLLILANTVGWFLLVEEIKQDLVNQKKEGECVAALIAQGYERADLATEQGKCYLIKDNL